MNFGMAFLYGQLEAGNRALAYGRKEEDPRLLEHWLFVLVV